MGKRHGFMPGSRRAQERMALALSDLPLSSSTTAQREVLKRNAIPIPNELFREQQPGDQTYRSCEPSTPAEEPRARPRPRIPEE